MNELLIILTLFIPLIGGCLAFLSKERAGIIATGFLAISFVSSVIATLSIQETIAFRVEWLPGLEIGIVVDKVSLLVISLVTLISFLVHLFSIEYMRNEEGVSRYYAKLGLFVFSMIGLLLADHLILLFVFWELVGLSSYLLIGFWYHKKGIPASARTAFMVNRVADAALLGGILLLYQHTGSLFITELPNGLLFLPSILIAIGAFGKSAQIPFSGWLTKAMVGPTPVSALIHAATMVAAGVYLLFRMAPYLHQEALMVIAITGTATAFYGGLCALNQHDIKKVLAYSTISQLGYMMIGIGVGARDASIFHLLTHAFFKAGLFLGAASIIHYLHKVSAEDAQDMRFMGGLRKELPWTFRSYVFCGLALAGVPLFSGFMSKDGIIIAAWTWANEVGRWAYLVPDLALLTALLTAFYVGRMILLVFAGESRSETSINKSSSEPIPIFAPLLVLAVFSVWIFFDLNPLSHHGWVASFMGLTPIEASGFANGIVPLLSLILVLAGGALAFSFFKPGSNYSNAYAQLGNPGGVASGSIFQGLYLTQLYDKVGNGIFSLSQLAKTIDSRLIDGFVHLVGVGSVVFSKMLALVDRFLVDGPVNLSASLTSYVGRRFAAMSSRDTQTQLIWMLVIFILILVWFILF